MTTLDVKLINKSVQYRFILISIICSLALLHGKIALGQSDYLQGYVVTIKNDTIYGLVKDRTKEPFGKLYTKIRLKQEGALFTKKFSASDLKSYKRGTDIFESIWLLEKSQFLKPIYISRKGVGKKVFMMLMAKGNLSYYHWEWRDPDSGIYMYIEMLKKERSNEMVRAIQGVFGLKRNVVADYLYDQPELANRIRSGEKLSLWEIVEIYNISVQ
jgi:hypothetical protein